MVKRWRNACIVDGDSRWKLPAPIKSVAIFKRTIRLSWLTKKCTRSKRMKMSSLTLKYLFLKINGLEVRSGNMQKRLWWTTEFSSNATTAVRNYKWRIPVQVPFGDIWRRHTKLCFYKKYFNHPKIKAPMIPFLRSWRQWPCWPINKWMRCNKFAKIKIYSTSAYPQSQSNFFTL